MSDLRNHLFETLEALKDKDDPMAIERAKAISDVGQTIINSAKVELQAMELIGVREPAPFFDQSRLPQPATSGHA